MKKRVKKETVLEGSKENITFNKLTGSKNTVNKVKQMLLLHVLSKK